MHTTVIELIAIFFGASALWDFIKFLITRSDNKKNSPEKQALLALCSERCETLMHKWIRADAEDRSVAKWASIKSLYDAYKALGGNGEIEALFNIASEIKPTE